MEPSREEAILPITTILSSPPRHHSLAPSISAYVYLDSEGTLSNEFDLVSSRDTVRNWEGGLEEATGEGTEDVGEDLDKGRSNVESAIFAAGQAIGSTPLSNALVERGTGVAEGFFRRDNRFSPSSPRQEDGRHDTAEPERHNGNADEGQDDDDQVSSYNAIVTEDPEEEEAPREVRAPVRAPSYNLMRIEGAHFNGKESVLP
jgi:hypothetical protein